MTEPRHTASIKMEDGLQAGGKPRKFDYTVDKGDIDTVVDDDQIYSNEYIPASIPNNQQIKNATLLDSGVAVESILYSQTTRTITI